MHARELYTLRATQTSSFFSHLTVWQSKNVGAVAIATQSLDISARHKVVMCVVGALLSEQQANLPPPLQMAGVQAVSTST